MSQPTTPLPPPKPLPPLPPPRPLPAPWAPGRGPQHNRARLVTVRRWARAHGWYPTWHGWTTPDRSLDIEVDTDVRHGADILIRRRDPVTGMRPMYSDRYRVDSVDQGIDLLVVLGVLPVELSSAYAAGVLAAQTAADAQMWGRAA